MSNRSTHHSGLFCPLILALSSTAFSQPDTLWSRIYEPDVWNSCNRIEQTEDGGFVIAGESGPSAGEISTWLMKVDSIGDLQWDSVYVDSVSSNSSAEDLLLLDGNRYMLAGWTLRDYYYDIWLFMTSGTGVIERERFIGESNVDEYVLDASPTSDGGFVLTGGIGNIGSESVLLLKTDSLLNAEWESTFPLNAQAIGYSVLQTSDGGYIIGGKTEYAIDGPYDCLVIKTDMNGELQWQNAFKFGWPYVRVGMISEAPQGGYLGIARELSKFTTVVFKLSETGDLLWNSRLYTGQTMDYLGLSSGYYLHSGFSGVYDEDHTSLSDRGGDGNFIMLTDSLGQSIWEAVYTNAIFINHSAGHVCATSDGGCCLAAGVQRSAGMLGVWLLRFGVFSGLEEDDTVEDIELILHPNPAASCFMVDFTLQGPAMIDLAMYDLSGRCVFESAGSSCSSGYNSIPVEGVGPGIYFVRISSDLYTGSGKVVVLDR